MARFARHIGIDYSGAQTPDASLAGLRCYVSAAGGEPVEVLPPPSPRRYWSRRGLAEWLVNELAAGPPTLVGIDHAFSFPLIYFDTHGLARTWDAFLDDFQRHWPTDDALTTVGFVRDGIAGAAAARHGRSRWRRLTDRQCRAKSVFHFDVPGQVATSTHAGLPWLRHIRQRLGGKVRFWPFDGWSVAGDRSVIAEVYPALCSAAFARGGRTPDQHDAYSVAAWLAGADRDATLADLFAPRLSEDDRRTAAIEGWILGITGVATAASPSSPRRPAKARSARP